MRWSFSLLGAAAALAACSSTTTTPAVTSSTVQGQLTLSSFTTPPTSVDALDEKGARVSAPISADGAFRFELTKGHVYKLSVVSPKGEEPIVFPRSSSRLDKTFRISSGAAVVALGSVHHYDRAPETIKTTAPGALQTKTEHADGEDGECVNGILQGTTTPCVDDDDKTTCGEGTATSDGDGECVNGKDAETGAACTDDDHVGDDENADPAEPMALPEKNAPDDVSGCNDGEHEVEDGEESDD